jgi:CRISPR system Cascade subunit CasE
MLSMEIDLKGAMAIAKRRGLPLGVTDSGYLAHVLMGEAFGTMAPSPFALRDRSGKHLSVLGYSRHSAAQLMEQASACAEPVIFNSLNWSACVSKPMPNMWQEGQNYFFEVRACPVVRMAKSSPKCRKGAEVDSFLQRCWEVDDPARPVNREEVYRDWLAGQFDRQGAAKLKKFALVGFRRNKLLRRSHDQNRMSKTVERPDALIKGTLEVRDGLLFSDLLARGVGRHRAFGFGMLLLKPSGKLNVQSE